MWKNEFKFKASSCSGFLLRLLHKRQCGGESLAFKATERETMVHKYVVASQEFIADFEFLFLFQPLV